MRCPKCHYLSFDPEPRCKNCGYDLEVDDADLALRTADAAHADGPMPDFALHERPAATAPPVTLELVPAKRRQGASVAFAGEGSEGREGTEDRSREGSEDRAREESEARRRSVREARLGRERRRVTETEEVEKTQAVSESDEVVVRDIAADRRMSASILIDEPPPAVRLGLVESVPVAPVVPVVPVVPVAPVASASRSPHTTSDLPLFVKAIADREALPDEPDENESQELDQFPPLESLLPPARPPLSVRRATPEPPRVRPAQPDRRIGPLDNDLLEDLKRVEREEARQNQLEVRETAAIAARTMSTGVIDLEDDGKVAPGHRVAAAAIDIAVLGSIAAFVFWATLRLCNINLSDLGMASLVPLALFLALMDVGYLLMFTAAGGQTVGKMVMGIRVVADTAGVGSPSLGQAAWRAVLTIVSVGALGLSWLPALFGRGPALHDRLAHTRVIRS